MNEYKNYHPVINLIYFSFATIFTCIFLHPVTLLISVVTSFSYSIVAKGAGAVKRTLLYIFPIMVLAAIINPLFNHQGVTILAYFPSGNPLTLESIYYGLVSGTMIASEILFFLCFNEVMTSDKLVYLFSRIVPSLSLVFSMTLRFVPRFIKQMRVIADARRCVGRDFSNDGIIKSIKNALSVMSAMVTWSLESAVDASDSMKSRGYGLDGRTAFSIYYFTKRDMGALIILVVSVVIIICGKMMGVLTFECFPMIQISKISLLNIVALVAYFILMSLPVLIETVEVIKWKIIKSKT